MTCAITIVPKPSGRRSPAATNIASSDEPITTSGVAIGRKMTRLDVRPPAEAVPHQRERHQRARGPWPGCVASEADGDAQSAATRTGPRARTIASSCSR